MNRDEATQLEKKFAVTFPVEYRHAITAAFPFAEAVEELDSDLESLWLSNEMCRKEDPWAFPWKEHYWCIGGDGAGGFYFVDTLQDDSRVYNCDHEDMPRSIDDLDRIGVSTFSEHIEFVHEHERDVQAWEEEMKARAKNRKWRQFWIPRQWPPYS